MRLRTLACIELLTMACVPATALEDADPFAVVPRTSWAYEAVDLLQWQGRLGGYPRGTFNGERDLTRFEFAIALQRMERELQDGAPGPLLEDGEQGRGESRRRRGLVGLSAATVDTLVRLVNEFGHLLAELKSPPGRMVSLVLEREQPGASSGHWLDALRKPAGTRQDLPPLGSSRSRVRSSAGRALSPVELRRVPASAQLPWPLNRVPMSDQEIEAELSYAYLHAVASRAGVACQWCSRSFDNEGIDAQVKAVRDFGPDAKLTELTVELQLKATVKQPSEKEGRFAYYLADIGRYNKLRARTVVPPRLLVVLFLPKEPARSSLPDRRGRNCRDALDQEGRSRKGGAGAGSTGYRGLHRRVRRDGSSPPVLPPDRPVERAD